MTISVKSGNAISFIGRVPLKLDFGGSGMGEFGGKTKTDRAREREREREKGVE